MSDDEYVMVNQPSEGGKRCKNVLRTGRASPLQLASRVAAKSRERANHGLGFVADSKNDVAPVRLHSMSVLPALIVSFVVEKEVPSLYSIPLFAVNR